MSQLLKDALRVGVGLQKVARHFVQSNGASIADRSARLLRNNRNLVNTDGVHRAVISSTELSGAVKQAQHATQTLLSTANVDEMLGGMQSVVSDVVKQGPVGAVSQVANAFMSSSAKIAEGGERSDIVQPPEGFRGFFYYPINNSRTTSGMSSTYLPHKRRHRVLFPVIGRISPALRPSKPKPGAVEEPVVVPPVPSDSSSAGLMDEWLPAPPKLGARDSFNPTERNIPSSSVGRLFGFGSIAANVIGGTVIDTAQYVLFGKNTAQEVTSMPLDVPSNNSEAPAGAGAEDGETSGDGNVGYVTLRNTERLTEGLCRLRGAALKIGQMLSIQDESLIPPQLQAILDKVRDQADIMPTSQLAMVLGEEFGPRYEDVFKQLPEDFEWDKPELWNYQKLNQMALQDTPDGVSEPFAFFDRAPFAAASIGQVHMGLVPRELLDANAHITSTEQHEDGQSGVTRDDDLPPFLPVAHKIQYPGVRESIHSDVDNFRRLITFMNVLPPGMFLEEAINSAKEELSLECDYLHEAKCQELYRSSICKDPLLSQYAHVPSVVHALSTQRVLTTEYVRGIPLDSVATQCSQATRDAVGMILLRLTLRELFDWRVMQTDPNWSNYLWEDGRWQDDATHTHTTQPGSDLSLNVPDGSRLHLIDFGATRQYPLQFVQHYLDMVEACANRDRDQCIESSLAMGFLTGEENSTMINAHVEAGFVVGEPFASDEPYDFYAGNIAGRVGEFANVMVEHRLTPPPKEAYTLHRKLSGCFLTCKKLRARFPCRQDFQTLLSEMRTRWANEEEHAVLHGIGGSGIQDAG